jgi:Flp pilus assembly protein TadG
MRRCDTRGNVSVEFIAIAVFLLIPICYIAIATLTITQAYLTVTAAARTGARAFSIQVNDAVARQRATNVINHQLALGNLKPKNFSTHFLCTETPCLKPNGFVTATIKGSERVHVPLLKPIRISITSSQTIEVDVIR